MEFSFCVYSTAYDFSGFPGLQLCAESRRNQSSVSAIYFLMSES